MLPASQFYLIPFLSALVGWVMSKIIISFYTTSVLKRKATLSIAIGNYAAQQFSLDAVEQKLTEPANIDKILPFAETHIDNFLRVKLPVAMPVLAMFISDKLVADMKGIFMDELKELFPAMIQQYLTNVKKDFDVSQLISTKLAGLSNNLLLSFLRKQLRIVEFSCAFTCFLCGCFYILLTPVA